MNTPKPYSKIAPDAELDYLAAGDEVCVLDDDLTLGILVDVEGTEACVRLFADDTYTYCHIDRIAHPDSPQAEAFAMFSDPQKP